MAQTELELEKQWTLFPFHNVFSLPKSFLISLYFSFLVLISSCYTTPTCKIVCTYVYMHISVYIIYAIFCMWKTICRWYSTRLDDEHWELQVHFTVFITKVRASFFPVKCLSKPENLTFERAWKLKQGEAKCSDLRI